MAPASGRDDAFPAQAAGYYEARYREHGDTARGMDWRDEASQRLRFEVLHAALGSPSDGSVLDIGCGNGELLAWLRSRGSRLAYLGIDVAPAMVAACQRRHGTGAARRATAADLLGEGARFDWVVASGTFNVKQDAGDAAWGRYVRRSVEQMFALSRRGAAFNAITTHVDFRRPHLYHFDPRSVPALARRCGTRFYRLDSSYPLWELTVALLRPEAA